MKKTTLVVDEDVLRRAQQALGTHSLKDTVDRALKEAIAADSRRALIRRLRTLDGLDLADEEVMRRAWGE